MEIVFATHNLNKLKEIQQLLPKSIKVLSLDDINCNEEIPETAATLEGNAKLKADYVSKHYNYNCFADDTGLEVDVLNGDPGVYSARYAGEECSAKDNMKKLLTAMQQHSDRTAQFKTVIALNLEDKQYVFEGVCKGEILYEEQGEHGFGYDPIFKPEGYAKSFAEMTLEDKGKISHRGKAVRELITFFQ